MAFAWSYSRLKMYEECPASYNYRHVLKAPYDDTNNEAFLKGRRVHGGLAAFLTGVPWFSDQDKKTYTEDMRFEAKSVAKFDAMLAQIKSAQPIVEQQWGFDANYRPSGWFGANVYYRNILDVGVLWPDNTFSVVDWKGLSLDTRLPTPTGWTTMGDVKVGSFVIDAAGVPSEIVGKSLVKNIACWRVTFDDAHSVVCDNEHLWPTARGVIQVPSLRRGDKVQVAEPAQLPAADLAVPPYTLGAWLGDGKHSDGSITKPDEELFSHIEEDGFVVLPPQRAAAGKVPARTVRGLRTLLAAAGVLRNKHIPQPYLRASVAQRVALLRGLMDTDGTWNGRRKQAVFEVCDANLADAVLELVSSLGERASLHVVKRKGFGLRVTAYMVAWAPRRFNPFRLSRKADKVVLKKARERVVRRVERVATVPTVCISVASSSSTFLYGDRWAVTHNTGRPYGDNAEQMEQFAVAVFSRYPQVHSLETRLAYVDTGQEQHEEFLRSGAAALKDKWEKRVGVLKNDKTFVPRPGGQCRRCPFAKGKGGPCAFGG